jgi:hypothetical protein
MEKCLITACSNRFFPSLLNLLGSLESNYAHHPKIYIYSLGLSPIFKQELQGWENLEIIDLPPFCIFWRSCYTWKTYIFNHPLAELNLFLDAGNQVLKPLDEMFEQINAQGYCAIGQGVKLKDIIPPEYEIIYKLPEEFLENQCVTAGIFGFKKSDKKLEIILNEVYEAALCGLCLGFSRIEQKRNKGKDKTQFIRGGHMFRHDQTLLNIFLRKYLDDLQINQLEKYGGWQSPYDHPEQLIWNLRRNYTNLEYAESMLKKPKIIKKTLLNSFLVFLSYQRKIKKILNNLRNK